MQIWFLNTDPVKSAEILYTKSPKRARKFVIEFMQAVAVLCERHGLPLPIKLDGTPYKTKLASRFPKPLMEWLGLDSDCFDWVYRMAYWISWITRTYQIMSFDNMSRCEELLITLPHTTDIKPFPNYAKSEAKSLDFSHIPDTIQAYNMYLEAQLK